MVAAQKEADDGRTGPDGDGRRHGKRWQAMGARDGAAAASYRFRAPGRRSDGWWLAAGVGVGDARGLQSLVSVGGQTEPSAWHSNARPRLRTAECGVRREG